MCLQKFKLFQLSGGFISGLLLFSPVSAKSLSHDELLDYSLEELINVRVTSSTLTEKSLRTAPSSITVFTYQQIQALGVDTLEELLNFVPGLQSFRQADAAHEYYHSVRGRRTGSASREVLVLIDGQRFNQAYTAATGVPVISLANIEKVEVIRGPGSAIYGSNAFTGVINITSRRDKNAIGLQSGSHNYQQVNASYSQNYEDIHLNLYANFVRDDGELYQLEKPVTHLHAPASDPWRGVDVNIKAGTEHTYMNVLYASQQASDFYVVEQFSNEYNKKSNDYSSIQLQHSVNSNDAMDTSLKVRYSEWSSFTRIPVSAVKTEVDFHEKTFDVNVDNNWTISKSHSLQFGVEQWYIRSEQAKQVSSLGEAVLNDETTRNVSGIYLQSQNRFSEDTELTSGLRFDHFTSASKAFSPRFALTHQLSTVQTVKFLYGHAFRAPDLIEMTLKNNSLAVGNPDLNPETIETMEMVWMGSWPNQTLTATVFNSRIKDSIVQQFNGVQRHHINADGVEESQGLEIEAILQLAAQWQLRAQYSLFDKLPQSAFRQADNLAAIILNYQLNHWNLNIAANHAAERQMLSGNSRIQLDNYWLLNAKLQYAFTGEQKIYLQAKNLADQDYFTPAQGRAFTAGIPNRGRELSLGLDWNF